MKICLAQIKPMKGSLQQNLLIHERFVRKASSLGANLAIFPELSLTGYEPTLAKELAMDFNSPVLNELQLLSDNLLITIIAGFPYQTLYGIKIGSVVFQPNSGRKIYSKRFLHEDELPFFESGTDPLYIHQLGQKISLAICYEVFVDAHAQEAFENNSTIYLASVAKTKTGIERAYDTLSKRARANKFPALIVNSVGEQDNFLAYGSSAVWDKNGKLLAQLNEKSEGILLFDCISEEIQVEIASFQD